jgi:ferritin-like metal-binding protein YciE
MVGVGVEGKKRGFTTMKQDLVSILADALDMERVTMEILEQRAERIRNHPEVVERFKKHIKESSWQVAQLENALRHLGAEPPAEASEPKPGSLAAIGALLASGEMLRNSIANSVFERFEMAAYMTAASAAEKAGEHEIARICDTIVRQEEAMAEWLEEHLPSTPLVYLMFDEIHPQVASTPQAQTA